MSVHTQRALDGAQFHANYIHSIKNSILIFIFEYTQTHTHLATEKLCIFVANLENRCKSKNAV